jgi:hypothetical protein
MKETITKKVARVLLSVAGAVLGEGVPHSSDHARRVRGTTFQDIYC